MKIALLGGAFNPPHWGHLLVAQQVLDFGGVDEIHFLPNYQQKYYGVDPHKIVASVEDRLAMLRCMEFSGASVSTLEIDHKLDGQTIHLLPFLDKRHEYSFIIGSDQLPRFGEWRGYKELLGAMRFLVVPRIGSPIQVKYPGMELLNGGNIVHTDISSTTIRNRIHLGEPIDWFVLPEVAQYIFTHGLYKEGTRKNIENI